MTSDTRPSAIPPEAFEIDQRELDEVALNRQEYTWIVELLGRAPNRLELGLFGAMWSEHCGYKNSRPLLKRFPSTGERVLLKVGEENAGAVDIGDGQAVVFKIETPQPPQRHRALPGRGHRRRRHRPRHLHDGRAARRPARLTALRPADHAAQPLPLPRHC